MTRPLSFTPGLQPGDERKPENPEPFERFDLAVKRLKLLSTESYMPSRRETVETVLFLQRTLAPG
jgi:hypothetical protein